MKTKEELEKLDLSKMCQIMENKIDFYLDHTLFNNLHKEKNVNVGLKININFNEFIEVYQNIGNGNCSQNIIESWSLNIFEYCFKCLVEKICDHIEKNGIGKNYVYEKDIISFPQDRIILFNDYRYSNINIYRIIKRDRIEDLTILENTNFRIGSRLDGFRGFIYDSSNNPISCVTSDVDLIGYEKIIKLNHKCGLCSCFYIKPPLDVIIQTSFEIKSIDFSKLKIILG